MFSEAELTNSAELDLVSGLDEFDGEIAPEVLTEITAADSTKCCASGTCD